MTFSCPHCGKALAVVAAEKKKPEAQQPPLANAKKAMSLEQSLSDFQSEIDVIDVEGALIVQPLGILSDEDFREINQIVKAYGGKYIKGATSERHWEVPT